MLTGVTFIKILFRGHAVCLRCRLGRQLSEKAASWIQHRKDGACEQHPLVDDDGLRWAIGQELRNGFHWRWIEASLLSLWGFLKLDMKVATLRMSETSIDQNSKVSRSYWTAAVAAASISWWIHTLWIIFFYWKCREENQHLGEYKVKNFPRKQNMDIA